VHLSLALNTTLVVIFVLSAVLGCNQQATGPAKPSARNADEGTAQASTDALAHPKWAPADEARGYLHKQSGVGFIYPEGWENLGAKSQGPITQLGLRKDGGAIEVTLYWTALDPDRDPETIGALELTTLRQLYHDKVSGPESVTVAGQPWKKLSIAGGPVGVNDPNLSGVVYVFAIRRNQQAWKIKLRATVQGPEKLAAVEELLNNYRQN
jgi:hypothetical protein